MKNPVKIRLFLLSKLPAAYFSGLRVEDISEERCIVSVPYKWFSQNPFRSTYFACLAMAAEMSTGALAMAHLYQRNPAVSMLVTGFEAKYSKKANQRTYFTCEEGLNFKSAIESAVATGEPQTISAVSTGRNASGDLIATAVISWSFKVKRS